MTWKITDAQGHTTTGDESHVAEVFGQELSRAMLSDPKAQSGDVLWFGKCSIKFVGTT